MNQKETIMICLNTLNIGGIETAALNQAITLIRKGYNVIALSKEGVLKNKFEEIGVTCIDFEYTIDNYFDKEKTNKILNIIREYNVQQIFVEQLYCVNDILTALIITKIPYVVYLHNGVAGEYDWFIKCFDGFDKILKIYFKNAYKIIAITESTKKENMELFNFKEERYEVIKNAIDLKGIEESIKNKKINKEENNREKRKEKISKYIIISRLDRDKKTSVINAIELFKEILKKNSKAFLTIVGDGDVKSELEEYAQDIKEKVTFLGKRNDVIDLINENDCVLGLGRCLIEGISVKRLSIVCGYEQKYILVQPSNIVEVSENNFTERQQKGMNLIEIIELLENLNDKSIDEILKGNYEFVDKNLNIDKNIFIIPSKELKENNIDMQDVVEYIFEIQKIKEELKKENNKVFNDGQEAIKWHQGVIENKDKEIERLIKELENKDKEIENLRKSFVNRFSKKIKIMLKKS